MRYLCFSALLPAESPGPDGTERGEHRGVAQPRHHHRGFPDGSLPGRARRHRGPRPPAAGPERPRAYRV